MDKDELPIYFDWHRASSPAGYLFQNRRVMDERQGWWKLEQRGCRNAGAIAVDSSEPYGWLRLRMFMRFWSKCPRWRTEGILLWGRPGNPACGRAVT
ncbi:hypothetical protein C4F51_05645 [Cellvibrio sp. KB43]|uniref:Uncharacterized protein n=1 Tax=Cellvibrio polysaccharolyticus TaxID=2082724 RepID=A0A928V0Q1_9GAMM|nr:hypothetical protein [Cellvibrio polysaccharolyticus]